METEVSTKCCGNVAVTQHYRNITALLPKHFHIISCYFLLFFSPLLLQKSNKLFSEAYENTLAWFPRNAGNKMPSSDSESRRWATECARKIVYLIFPHQSYPQLTGCFVAKWSI